MKHTFCLVPCGKIVCYWSLLPNLPTLACMLLWRASLAITKLVIVYVRVWSSSTQQTHHCYITLVAPIYSSFHARQKSWVVQSFCCLWQKGKRIYIFILILMTRKRIYFLMCFSACFPQPWQEHIHWSRMEK